MCEAAAKGSEVDAALCRLLSARADHWQFLDVSKCLHAVLCNNASAQALMYSASTYAARSAVMRFDDSAVGTQPAVAKIIHGDCCMDKCGLPASLAGIL